MTIASCLEKLAQKIRQHPQSIVSQDSIDLAPYCGHYAAMYKGKIISYAATFGETLDLFRQSEYKNQAPFIFYVSKNYKDYENPSIIHIS